VSVPPAPYPHDDPPTTLYANAKMPTVSGRRRTSTCIVSSTCSARKKENGKLKVPALLCFGRCRKLAVATGAIQMRGGGGAGATATATTHASRPSYLTPGLKI
jgi:hypothetical protein